MVTGGNGTNSGTGAYDPGQGETDDSATSSGAVEQLSALLPFILTMLTDRSRTRSMRLAFRFQMLLWVLSLFIDQLDATKGVMERARGRLKDIDPRLHQGTESDDGAEW